MTIEPWMTRAAEDIIYQMSDRPRQTYVDMAATIIAECAPRVRALEWKRHPDTPPDRERLYADSLDIAGYYSVSHDVDHGWLAETFDSDIGYYPTIDAAKAAAQADFERRVSECFAEAQTESTPTDDEPGDFERGNY